MLRIGGQAIFAAIQPRRCSRPLRQLPPPLSETSPSHLFYRVRVETNQVWGEPVCCAGQLSQLPARQPRTQLVRLLPMSTASAPTGRMTPSLDQLAVRPDAASPAKGM